MTTATIEKSTAAGANSVASTIAAIPSRPAGAGKTSKAMADQLATVSMSRLFKKAGSLSDEDMLKIGEAIKLQLGL